ncbi:hypothetical protein V8E51_006060 [Hyaloscypha variabilis]
MKVWCAGKEDDLENSKVDPYSSVCCTRPLALCPFPCWSPLSCHGQWTRLFSFHAISISFALACASAGRSILGKHSPPQALFVAVLQCVRRRTAHQRAVLSSPSLTPASRHNTLCSPLWHRYQPITCHHQHEASPACSGSQLQTQLNAGNWHCTDADRDLVPCADVVLPQVLQARGFHSIGVNVCALFCHFSGLLAFVLLAWGGGRKEMPSCDELECIKHDCMCHRGMRWASEWESGKKRHCEM